MKWYGWRLKVSGLQMHRKVFEGNIIPSGYGIAWRRCDYAVCFPIPLNFIVSILYTSWWRLKKGFNPSKLETDLQFEFKAGYNNGYNVGYENGYKLGRKHGESHYAERLWDLYHKGWRGEPK